LIQKFDPDIHGAEVFKGFEKDSNFVKVNPAHCQKIYKDMCDRGTAGGFVIIEDGEVKGGIGGIIGPDLHSGESIAVETFWFVAPGFRGGWGAYELWKKFEEWAKENGCKKIGMTHLVDSHPDRLKRVYEARGYKLAELHYLREI
jgi:GNAT superfamily N-acetyltransferase